MPVMHISDLSWGGQGIGRIDGKVVFVPQALPGEEVEIDLVESRKDYSLGRLLQVLTPSPDRIVPPCPFYQACGGCQLQHLNPDKQGEEKERLFTKALRHALPDRNIPIFPILRSPRIFAYRHRLLLKTGWSNKKFSLGFYKPQSHQLVPINGCALANSPVNTRLDPLREKIQALGYRDWTPDVELQLFEDPPGGGLVFSSTPILNPVRRKKVAAGISSLFPSHYILFQEFDQLVDGDGRPFAPEKESPTLLLPAEETGLPRDLRLAAFPKVFTQINLEANRLLIARLFKPELFTRRDRVLDCFCGFGNFTLPAALVTESVMGVESFPWAVANARWNQKNNGITNCSFIAGKADALFRKTRPNPSAFSLAILDPPRTGIREMVPLLDGSGLRRLLYISCNPSTLFRDLALLADRGWIMEWSQPVDFFPQTFHLESLTLLRKK
jgi:23S rRNA (uracil1939-C5)-methyltransferase